MKEKFVLAAAAATLLSLSSCDKLSRTESVTDLGFELPYILPGEYSESTTYKNRPFFLKVTLKVTGKVTRKSIRCDRMRCNGVQVRKITPRVN